MARSACLHAAGTCRARLDRCRDPPFARAHTEGGTRGTRCAFHRGGTDEPDRDDQRHQWLEPHRGGLRPLVRGRRAGEGGLMTPAGIQRAVDAAGAAASFDPLPPLLTRVAYRMLGSVADAEAVVQVAFIRWPGTHRASVRATAAFLPLTGPRPCHPHL